MADCGLDIFHLCLFALQFTLKCLDFLAQFFVSTRQCFVLVLEDSFGLKSRQSEIIVRTYFEKRVVLKCVGECAIIVGSGGHLN